MDRKEGDMCPKCNEGHLTFSPKTEKREDMKTKNTQSFETWICNKCGKETKDHKVGFFE